MATTAPSEAPGYAGVRVVVLGAAGFIGRWVARRLCAQGAEVCLAVRDRAAAEAVFARYGVRGHIVEVELQDPAALQRAFEVMRPAITFNLAGYGVDPAERDETAAYRINAGLVTRIARAAAAARDANWPGQHLVHAGSALEYGTLGGNLDEDSRPRPTTLYGRSKLAGTLCLARCSRRLGLRSVTARLFTVYGPGERSDRLLPALIRAARTGERLPLTEGAQRRDFIYVDEAAEGLLRLGQVQAGAGPAVNLATGRLTPVREFVTTAAALLQIPPDRLEFGHLPVRAWEVNHAPVTLAALRRLTGWSPTNGIEAGIRITMEFEGYRAAPVR